MSNRMKYLVITVGALLISVLPPLIVTLYFFPLWVETSAEATLSGTVCVLGLICLVPFGKYVMQLMRSPSAPLLWMIFTLIMFVMRAVADQMFTVGVVGTVSNVVGAILFKVGKRYRKKE